MTEEIDKKKEETINFSFEEKKPLLLGDAIFVDASGYYKKSEQQKEKEDLK